MDRGSQGMEDFMKMRDRERVGTPVLPEPVVVHEFDLTQVDNLFRTMKSAWDLDLYVRVTEKTVKVRTMLGELNEKSVLVLEIFNEQIEVIEEKPGMWSDNDR